MQFVLAVLRNHVAVAVVRQKGGSECGEERATDYASDLSEHQLVSRALVHNLPSSYLAAITMICTKSGLESSTSMAIVVQMISSTTTLCTRNTDDYLPVYPNS